MEYYCIEVNRANTFFSTKQLKFPFFFFFCKILKYKKKVFLHNLYFYFVFILHVICKQEDFFFIYLTLNCRVFVFIFYP